MIETSFERPSMPSEVTVGCEIDYSDPAAVRDQIRKLHPFGELLLYEGIVEICRRGRGRELIELSTPPEMLEPDEIALAEVIDPSVEWITSVENLERRAYIILATGFYGTDEAHREAILSVRDAGVVGLLAQANLRPPEKKRQRPRHRARVPRLAGGRPNAAARATAPVGDLFAAFED